MSDKKRLIRNAIHLLLQESKQAEILRKRLGALDEHLPGHPFGLPPLVQSEHEPSIRWSNYGTDVACASICELLANAIREENTEFGLRIIKVQVEYGVHNWNPDAPCHNYFFEYGNHIQVFIAGACTDCSGEGGCGMQTLDTVFRFVAELCDRPIQEVTLSATEGQRALAGVRHWLEQVA